MSSALEPVPWKLEWTEALSVCIPEIDVEHQRFIGLVNNLNEALISRMDIEEVKRRMRALQEDAVLHFSHEEELFRQWHYPDADAHAQKHAQAVRFLDEIMTGFSQTKTEFEWIETALKVKQVLTEHILQEDLKYRDFCLARRFKQSL